MDLHACAREVEGGEVGLLAATNTTKGPTVEESEGLLETSSVKQPRFLQSEDRGPWYCRFSKRALFFGQVALFAVVVVQFIMLYRSYALAAVGAAGLADAAVLKKQESSSAASDVPDYYVTKPMLLPGQWTLRPLSLERLLMNNRSHSYG